MNGFVPPWSPWYATASRGGVPNPDMRVGDAERSEMADSLSKHYADGRLDEEEFNDRLQRAMSAKTRGDLAGLLADLPPATPPPAPDPEVFHRRSRFALVALAVFLFFVAASSVFWTWHFPWFLFLFVFFFAWRRSRWGWHRHRHPYWPGPGPSGAGGPPYYGSGPWTRRGPGGWV